MSSRRQPQTSGRLAPPPRKPPTAIGTEALGPEPAGLPIWDPQFMSRMIREYVIRPIMEPLARSLTSAWSRRRPMLRRPFV